MKGLEPSRISPLYPKCSASANSATLTYNLKSIKNGMIICTIISIEKASNNIPIGKNRSIRHRNAPNPILFVARFIITINVIFALSYILHHLVLLPCLVWEQFQKQSKDLQNLNDNYSYIHQIRYTAQ